MERTLGDSTPQLQLVEWRRVGGGGDGVEWSKRKQALIN